MYDYTVITPIFHDTIYGEGIDKPLHISNNFLFWFIDMCFRCLRKIGTWMYINSKRMPSLAWSLCQSLNLNMIIILSFHYLFSVSLCTSTLCHFHISFSVLSSFATLVYWLEFFVPWLPYHTTLCPPDCYLIPDQSVQNTAAKTISLSHYLDYVALLHELCSAFCIKFGFRVGCLSCLSH